jgi:hypothetical protein
MTKKPKDSGNTGNIGIRPDEIDQLETLHDELSGRADSLQGGQLRKFEQITQRYQQFRRDWRSGQGGQNRQEYDSLRADMQRMSQARREPVGAGVEEEEEEEH